MFAISNITTDLRLVRQHTTSSAIRRGTINNYLWWNHRQQRRYVSIIYGGTVCPERLSKLGWILSCGVDIDQHLGAARSHSETMVLILRILTSPTIVWACGALAT